MSQKIPSGSQKKTFHWLPLRIGMLISIKWNVLFVLKKGVASFLIYILFEQRLFILYFNTLLNLSGKNLPQIYLVCLKSFCVFLSIIYLIVFF